MAEAVALGQRVRTETSPNPWVGAVVVPAGDQPAAEGATRPPGGPHAEVVALDLAGASARGATVYVTLEPCSHYGRTPPCTDALIAAGVRRVVVGIVDPDPLVSGRGLARLRDAGIEVEVGVLAAEVEASLRPYLAHRRRGRPWVVLKLAATLDGRIAAPDRSSRWITGPAARRDAHQLRAESDAILVGAGTVRADDPALTVRDVPGRDPLRVVLGHPPGAARALPGPRPRWGAGATPRRSWPAAASSSSWSRAEPTWPASFHRRGLIDQYVLYLAPVLLGGDDGLPLFAGPGTPTLAGAWRGRISALQRLGPDVRVDLLAAEADGVVP